MDGDAQREPRAGRGIRQAVLALAVSALVVAGIVAVTDDDGGRVALAPATSVVDTTAITSPPVTEAPPVDVATAPGSSAPGPTGAPASTAPSATTVAPPTTAGSSTLGMPMSTTVAAPATGLPVIDGKAYAVLDATNGVWLAGNQADTQLPVGSVMKLLTSYVVLQAGDLDKVVTVPRLQVDISESSIGLYAGESLSRAVLFRAMLIVSANDAAQTLAMDVGGSTQAFVQRMNEAAATLGLSNTAAMNPIGLDATGAHSSARDVITLAALLMQNDTFHQAVGKSSAKLHGKVFASTNKLLTTYDGADGVKTGHTTGAGYCLVGSATRNGRTIIVAVLGASSDEERLAGATALLDWGFSQP